jgi:hypothetical protein
MAANAQIFELENLTTPITKPNYDAMLALSLSYNLISKAASFVVVEKRNEAAQVLIISFLCFCDGGKEKRS